MQDESRSSKQLKLNKCLENAEVQNRLLRFFEVMMKIDDRERLLKPQLSNIKIRKEQKHD